MTETELVKPTWVSCTNLDQLDQIQLISYRRDLHDIIKRHQDAFDSKNGGGYSAALGLQNMRREYAACDARISRPELVS